MSDDPIRWLYGLERFGVKLGLDTTRWLLERLGHPEAAFPCLLVGGTNGKGSVAATVDAVLGAAGVRAGLFTSPHLVRPNERIRIGGHDIGTADLCGHLTTVRERIDAGLAEGAIPAHPSFFEVATAAALEAFRASEVAAAVLEVGMGGRLDATNATEPLTSVVVSVALDHMDRLGGTLAAIAAEKAAIARAGRPLVCGPLPPEAAAVVEEACAKVGARVVDAASAGSWFERPDGGFTLVTGTAVYSDLALALRGAHQRVNAGVAVLAAETFCREAGIDLPADAVRRGLASVRWPGRLQWLPGSPPVLLDGAHNPAGALALARHLGEIGARPVLLFGAQRGKDAAGILAPLADRVEALVLTRSGVDHAAPPDELLALAPACIRVKEVVEDSSRALDRARELAGPRGLVLVAGSLYLIGDILGIIEGGDVPGPVPF